MELIYLVKGFAIGFSLAAPVGPIGVLCIRRTLAHGTNWGLIIGLAAACADTIYGVVAAFGVTLISNFISDHLPWFRLIGGVLLLVLGFRTLRAHPLANGADSGNNGQIRAFFSTFLLTLTNPMTLFAFAAVFAGVGLDKVIGHYGFATLLVVGVFAGSLAWFAFLASLVHFLREKVSIDGLALINKTAGSLLIAFAVVAIWSGATGF